MIKVGCERHNEDKKVLSYWKSCLF